jgi:hypothetical protein
MSIRELEIEVRNLVVLEADRSAIWCNVGEGALNHLAVACVFVRCSFTKLASDIDCGFQESRFLDFDPIRRFEAVTWE